MFTNTEIITVFHKKVDARKHLEIWEKHTFRNVYWENCSSQSAQNKGMSESNYILCIIPENSIGDFIPCKDDRILKGDVQSLANLTSDQYFTVMTVKNFLYGSDRVHHIEVNAE